MKINENELEVLLLSKNLNYKKCNEFHYQIIHEKIKFNYYPTKNTLYINGMNKGFKINTLKELLHIILTKQNIKCEKVKRTPLTSKKRKLWEKNKHCAICGKPLLKYSLATVDHIIPISKGGSNRLDNLQLVHEKCNFDKKDKI